MPRTVPLIELPARAIEPLLAAQTCEWRKHLLWDFTRTADRLLFLAELRTLAGLALVDDDGAVIGYGCCDVAGTQIEFTDFYVLPERRSIESNTELFKGFVDYLPREAERLALAPAIAHEIDPGTLPLQPRVSTAVAEAAAVERVCAGFRADASAAVWIRPWQESDHVAAYALVPSSYTHRVDPHPEWYSSPNGVAASQNFLESVISKQSTFQFLPDASVVAIHRESGRLCGFLLASHAMEGVAYANFLCVANWAAAYRLGNRLSVAHCLMLRTQGYHTVTLRRRTDNPRLARFYARMGFVKQFDQIIYEWGAA